MALYSEGKMDMEDYLAFSMKPLENIPIKEVCYITTTKRAFQLQALKTLPWCL